MENLIKCDWCLGKFPEYEQYHDEEWGVPVHDDLKHFEFLILEGAQAGLSWATILKKREGYRNAFKGFDPQRVAELNKQEIESLYDNPQIIRNRQKINAAINNAKKFLEVQKELGSFDKYIWQFTDGKPIINQWKEMKEIPPSTSLSDTISKDLKSRGFKFVGSTIIYAHLQACGIVNDHLVNCFRYDELT